MRQNSRLLSRCPRCRLRPTLCLCKEIPRLPITRSRLSLVIHRYEAAITTNTGLFVAEALPDSRVIWRGGPDSQQSLSWKDRGNSPWIHASELSDESVEELPLFLFPGPDSIVLSREWVQQQLAVRGSRLRFRLIVPDSSWRQAKRVGRREPALKEVLRIALPPGPPSEYRLRRQTHPSHLCTYEAVARSLGILEERGAEIQGELENLFRKFVDRQLWARGDIRTEAVTGGIPPAALKEYERGHLFQEDEPLST